MTTGMTQWEKIGCAAQGEHGHETITVEVDLAERHAYFDYPPVPERLCPPPFQMDVWDWEKAPPPGTGWCPQRDVVSETIDMLGIWEPVETIAMLCLFEGADQTQEDWVFYDMGAQIGWYSVLAKEYSIGVKAYEADPDVMKVLKKNLARFTLPATTRSGRITGKSKKINDDGPAIAKIDVEGAEVEALAMLSPLIHNSGLHAALIEMSPVFGVDTDEIVDILMSAGFGAAFLPDKSMPPAKFEYLADLAWFPPDASDAVAQAVSGLPQSNVLFVRQLGPLGNLVWE